MLLLYTRESSPAFQTDDTSWLDLWPAQSGGGAAGDSFAFTVFFDPDEAPINYAIFGPEFTFTGEMIEGEISIDVPH